MDLKELNEVVKNFDGTGIGRCFALLATLAERGMNVPGLDSPATFTALDDPLWSPTKAANHLDVTVATLRAYRHRYGMESIGSGKSRRYRRSEVERIVSLRQGNCE